MKQMIFYNLLSNPKNGIIYFGAQTNGWLATSKPNGKSSYDFQLESYFAVQPAQHVPSKIL